MGCGVHPSGVPFTQVCHVFFFWYTVTRGLLYFSQPFCFNFIVVLSWKGVYYFLTSLFVANTFFLIWVSSISAKRDRLRSSFAYCHPFCCLLLLLLVIRFPIYIYCCSPQGYLCFHPDGWLDVGQSEVPASTTVFNLPSFTPPCKGNRR